MNSLPQVDLSVVVPVYQSAQTLPTLVDRLLPVLDGTGMTHEVIFVEDGSRDNSWQVLEKLQSGHPDRVVAIQLMRNYGQHNALMAGFRRSRGKLVVTMDDDLQHPPEEIPKLIESVLKSDLDLVYGTYESKRHSGWRNLGSQIIQMYYQHVFQNKVQPTAFRVIRRPLLESILNYSLNYTVIDGLLAWNTGRIGEVQVAHHQRAGGRSGYSPLRLLATAVTVITNFSLLPLQLVSSIGLISATGGLLLGAYYLIQHLMSNIEVPGYASTIVAILVFSGLQLLALGIMGEYLGRLHMNVNRKPQYTVRQTLDRADSDVAARAAGAKSATSPPGQPAGTQANVVAEAHDEA